MRAEGYYWVKPKKNDQVSGEWMVMHWQGTCFYYEAELYYDRDFNEIDERRIERKERDSILEEAIVFLGKQFPEYGNKEFSITEIRRLLQSIK